MTAFGTVICGRCQTPYTESPDPEKKTRGICTPNCDCNAEGVIPSQHVPQT